MGAIGCCVVPLGASGMFATQPLSERAGQDVVWWGVPQTDEIGPQSVVAFAFGLVRTRQRGRAAVRHLAAQQDRWHSVLGLRRGHDLQGGYRERESRVDQASGLDRSVLQILRRDPPVLPTHQTDEQGAAPANLAYTGLKDEPLAGRLVVALVRLDAPAEVHEVQGDVTSPFPDALIDCGKHDTCEDITFVVHVPERRGDEHRHAPPPCNGTC